MKIVASAWMGFEDKTTGYESSLIVESTEELKRFKAETDDDVFDIVYTYHLIPNDTDYDKYYYDPDSLMELVSCTENEVNETTALLMLSTVPAKGQFMYTLIFLREPDGDSTDGVVEFHGADSIVAVERLIKAVVRRQVLLERTNKGKYTYGEYGFVLLKNGELVDEYNSSFSNMYSDFECISQSKEKFSINKVVQQISRLLSRQTSFINDQKTDERFVSNSLKPLYERLEKENTDRKRLKELMKKYPDVVKEYGKEI